MLLACDPATWERERETKIRSSQLSLATLEVSLGYMESYLNREGGSTVEILSQRQDGVKVQACVCFHLHRDPAALPQIPINERETRTLADIDGFSVFL